jgi:hypothetical protein
MKEDGERKWDEMEQKEEEKKGRMRKMKFGRNRRRTRNGR